MEELTVSTKALVHFIGLILGIIVAIAEHLSPPDRKASTLTIGMLLLIIYFLVMPESYLHELFFGTK